MASETFLVPNVIRYWTKKTNKQKKNFNDGDCGGVFRFYCFLRGCFKLPLSRKLLELQQVLQIFQGKCLTLCLYEYVLSGVQPKLTQSDVCFTNSLKYLDVTEHVSSTHCLFLGKTSSWVMRVHKLIFQILHWLILVYLQQYLLMYTVPIHNKQINKYIEYFKHSDLENEGEHHQIFSIILTETCSF